MAPANSNVAVARENAANWCGNIGRTQAGHRDLIEKRLKDMMIFPVNKWDFDAVLNAEDLRGIESRESSTDD